MQTRYAVPVDIYRVQTVLQETGIQTFIDDDGDLGMVFHPHVFYLTKRHESPFTGICMWYRNLNVGWAKQAAGFCAAHNATFFAPKCYTVVSDEGMLAIRLLHCFNWTWGATDTQITNEVKAFIQTSQRLFEELEKCFPDRWSKPPKDEDTQ